MKPGDRVTIRKPVNVDEDPGWVLGTYNMDRFDGSVQTVYDAWVMLFKYGQGATPVFTIREASGNVCPIMFNQNWIEKTASECNCSVTDLWTWGHKCGRKAAIDK
jgi:hypothetical protein